MYYRALKPGEAESYYETIMNSDLRAGYRDLTGRTFSSGRRGNGGDPGIHHLALIKFAPKPKGAKHDGGFGQRMLWYEWLVRREEIHNSYRAWKSRVDLA